MEFWLHIPIVVSETAPDDFWNWFKLIRKWCISIKRRPKIEQYREIEDTQIQRNINFVSLTQAMTMLKVWKESLPHTWDWSFVLKQ